MTIVLKPSQINFPGQINDYLNNFFFNTCMQLELTDYNNMCSMIVTRETSKWWTFLYRMFVVFFYFYFCNWFQYQQFSKLTSFCRINVLILVFGILLIKCIAKMHKITEDTTNNSITIFFYSETVRICHL